MLVFHERTPGPRGDVHRALTARAGGVSGAPYASLNLGDHVGDDPAAVAANREALAEAVGVPADHVVVARQVHGRAVTVVDAPWAGGPPDADALVTTRPGLTLAVLVADCVPVMLAAPEQGIVAVAHAGRRGMVDGVVEVTVDTMRRLGAGDILATVGPSICARCYEVPLVLRDEVAARRPVAASVTRRGAPAVDVAGGVLEQLRALGATVDQLPGCTAEDDSYFSYRRDGRTGRFAGLVWVEARR